MKLAQHSRIKAEGIGIWLVLLAVLGGGVWFLYSSRNEGDKNARVFANEVAQRIAVNFDEKYLNHRLNPKSQAMYLPSWRLRFFNYLRDFGPMAKSIETKGDVYFTSYFFEPRGRFRSQLTYPTITAVLETVVSRGMNAWQIDEINLIWEPPPAPSPTPSPVMSPSPTPTPTPEPKPRRKKGRG